MIRPLGGPSSTPVPATRSGEAHDAGPQDRVTLGATPLQAPPPPVAAPLPKAAEPPPPALPPLVQEEAPFYRAAMLPGLHDVEGQFRDGKLEGDAFQEAALRLSRANETETDPFVARKIQQVLYERVQGTTPVAEWQLKKGMLDGPLEMLGGKIDSLPRNDYNWFTDDSFLPFLDAVAAQTAAQVPEHALKTVAHLATSLMRRAENPLKPEIREHETADDDRRWADECAAVLDEWHARGLITVRRGDEVLAPGSVDLLAEAGRDRMAVRGNTLDVAPRVASRSPEADAFLKDFRYWDKDEEGCPKADELQARGAELVRGIVEGGDLLGDRERTPQLARLVREAATRPALKELLRPHLPVLATVASRSAERGQVAPDNLTGSYKVQLYAALMATFPELATKEFLEREMAPLLLADEINTGGDAAKAMLVVWKEHPELVGPTMDVALSDSKLRVGHAAEQLVLPALKEHGWSPTPQQQDMLLAQLYVPSGKQPRSLFSWYESVQRGLGYLQAFEERSPGYVDRLKLPDAKGMLVPARRALLDRLLNDSSDDLVRYLYSRSSGHHLASACYKVIFPNPELAGELLDRLESAYRAGQGLAAMPVPAQAAAAVLGSVALSREEEARLDALFAPEIPKKGQGLYVFNDIVESVRRRYLDREAARLPELPPAQRLARAEELLTLAHETHQDYDAEQGRVLKLVTPHLAGVDVAPLVDSVRADLAGGTPLEDLGPAATARLQLADALATEEQLLPVVRPRLRDQVGYGNRGVEGVMHRWRWTKSLEALESPRVELARRSEALELGLFEAEDQEHARGQVLEALEKGLAGGSRRWVDELRRRFPDPEPRLQALRTIAGASPTDAVADARWPRFVEVLERVGTLDDASKVWPSWERRLAEGIERDEALRIAMLEHALGGSLDDGPRAITKAASTVVIGGIELPVHNSAMQD